MSTVLQLAPRRQNTERLVYSVREVANLLSLSLGITYQLVREGEIPAIQAGRRWVIPRQRFHAWLNGDHEHTELAKGA